jgi:hypothetical protein
MSVVHQCECLLERTGEKLINGNFLMISVTINPNKIVNRGVRHRYNNKCEGSELHNVQLRMHNLVTEPKLNHRGTTGMPQRTTNQKHIVKILERQQ